LLNIGWRKAKTITAEEKEIAAEVAGQITIAIEQASLLKETKRYAAELEERVRQRTALLEASNKELEAFSYSVSHDLRAPLRHISGFADMMAKEVSGKITEKADHYLDTINDSAKKMGVLIDNLLNFSRTGRAEMMKSSFNMNKLVEEALLQLKPSIEHRNINWNIAALPKVFGDYNLLRLVWVNLLENAIKYTRTRKKAVINIAYSEDNEEYVFIISDNGVGFDMQYAAKLFGVFQRLHSSAAFEGTGIGLANVRRIILKHGGRTWAEAELEKGAAFYFSLPKKL
jgi:light-regulated signal transduction histidine kinase (bacteriophytochrome)